MTRSTNLKLPYIAPGQAQKYITHNEAILRLDTLVQLNVTSQQKSPPADALADDRYLVGSEAFGAWTGYEMHIAQLGKTGNWVMHAPSIGWTCFVRDEAQIYYFDTTEWQQITQALPENIPDKFGINTQADDINRLAVKSNYTLLDHEEQSHTLKINKASSAGIASLQYQAAYQSFAEIGLIGNNELAIKVTSDAENWTEALSINTSTAHTRCDNLYSGEINVLNDTVITLTPPKSGGFLMIMMDNTNYPQLSHCALIAFDTGISPNILKLAGGYKLVVLTNETLSGTTGTDGLTTISAIAGNLLIENRYGTPQNFRYTFLG